jgi:hypothetical protein
MNLKINFHPRLVLNYRLIILILLIFTSCKRNNCKPVKIQDYSVEITFSSFWDCGDFKKIILNNRNDVDPALRIKEYSLYEIRIKNNCSKSQIDTLARKITINQSDSIYELTYSFITNYKLNNIVSDCNNVIRTVNTVQDGANIKIELCLENKCKSFAFYHYGHLKDISNDLNKLIDYINLIQAKK